MTLTLHKRPFLIGLTGSIGMGKSTTSQMFHDQGCPIWSADAAVHRLYFRGNAGYTAIATLCPAAAGPAQIDRAILGDWLRAKPIHMASVEALIHPLVAKDRAEFVAQQDADVVVLDIPLLFETGADAKMDAIVVVTAPPGVQRARVLARPGMDATRFDDILARQMPDAQKRNRADFIIHTETLDQARHDVDTVLSAIKSGWRRPKPKASPHA